MVIVTDNGHEYEINDLEAKKLVNKAIEINSDPFKCKSVKHFYFAKLDSSGCIGVEKYVIVHPYTSTFTEVYVSESDVDNNTLGVSSIVGDYCVSDKDDINALKVILYRITAELAGLMIEDQIIPILYEADSDVTNTISKYTELLYRNLLPRIK